ncbi:MAG: hypothetical protein ACI4GO_05565 [Hominenteromicrobium sp.]
MKFRDYLLNGKRAALSALVGAGILAGEWLLFLRTAQAPSVYALVLAWLCFSLAVLMFGYVQHVREKWDRVFWNALPVGLVLAASILLSRIV